MNPQLTTDSYACERWGALFSGNVMYGWSYLSGLVQDSSALAVEILQDLALSHRTMGDKAVDESFT